MRGMLASIPVAAVTAAFIQSPAGAGLVLNSRVTANSEVTVTFKNIEALERDVTLTLKADPAQVAPDRLEEIIAGYDLRDAGGRPVTGAVDADVRHDVIISFSGGSAEIVNAARDGERVTVTGLFKDADGRITVPPDDQIGMHRLNGDRLCHRRAPEEEAEEVNPKSFVLLLDTSGSMEDLMDEVRGAALSFIDQLPDTATCAVGAFSERWSFDANDGLGVHPCKPENFDLSKLEAGGGTELFVPLGWSFDWLNEAERADHQKAVIVLSDGHVTDSLAEARRVAGRKGDAFLFTYYLGDSDDAWLKDLADNYLAADRSLRGQLEAYFGVVSDAFAKQTVLHVNACDQDTVGGGHGAR